jgi:alpha-N-acetylglucosaminidase
MAGVGAAPEGVNNNPVVYDLLFDPAWMNKPVDLRAWIRDYVKWRYGEDTPELEHAWQLLLETVYKSSERPEPIFCARPSLAVKGVSTWGSTKVPYQEAKLEEAAQDFLKGGDRLRGIDAYQYDAVNLVRQVLSNRGLEVYHKMVTAYQAHDVAGFEAARQKFLKLLCAEDSLLRTRREFMVGTWLAAAKAMGHSGEEKNLSEKNARTLITYWGPDDPATDVRDYAYKEWSGLLEDYYLPRWEMFVEDLGARLRGRPGREINYFEFEHKWTEELKDYPVDPRGDPVRAAAAALASLAQR